MASTLSLTACAPSPVIVSSSSTTEPPFDAAKDVGAAKDALLSAAAAWRASSASYEVAVADQLFYYARFISRANPLDSKSGLAQGLVEPVPAETIDAARSELASILEEQFQTALAEKQTNFARLWVSILVSTEAAHTLAVEGTLHAGLPPAQGDFIPWNAPADTNEILVDLSDSLYLLRKLITASIGLGGGGVGTLLSSTLAQVDAELDTLTLAGISYDDPLPSGLPVPDRQGLASDIPATIARYAGTTREYWLRSALVNAALVGHGIESATLWDILVRKLGGQSPYWPGWQH